MKKFIFDFDLDAWVRSLEIMADSKDEALDELYSMSIEDLIDQGYVKYFDLKNVDVDIVDYEEGLYDSKDPEVFFLSFDVDNSLKGSTWSEEYIGDWCDLDYSDLNFDHKLTEDEVRKFLRETIPYCAKLFNKYNKGYGAVDGEVKMNFTNLCLYKLNDELEIDDSPIAEYPDMEFSFIAKSH